MASLLKKNAQYRLSELRLLGAAKIAILREEKTA
jgi:hypothetical protein